MNDALIEMFFAAAFVAVVIFNYAANYTQEWIVGRLAGHLLFDLRRAMYRHLQFVALGFTVTTNDPGPHPVLLQRTPYDKSAPLSLNMLDPIKAAKRGYAVVIQDTRGRDPHASRTRKSGTDRAGGGWTEA